MVDHMLGMKTNRDLGPFATHGQDHKMSHSLLDTAASDPPGVSEAHVTAPSPPKVF